MDGNYLLDTNIVIGLFTNDQKILNKLQSTGDLFLPSIVLGELIYGALNSKNQKDNLKRIEDFASGILILDCDEETARAYGALKISLKRSGHPIPENDLWIAAISKQYQLTLVTRDAHFQGIDGLVVEYW